MAIQTLITYAGSMLLIWDFKFQVRIWKLTKRLITGGQFEKNPDIGVVF